MDIQGMGHDNGHAPSLSTVLESCILVRISAILSAERSMPMYLLTYSAVDVRVRLSRFGKMCTSPRESVTCTGSTSKGLLQYLQLNGVLRDTASQK